ncbi:hypothetical protein PR048_001972 [Dryococelus australis]|uniref:DDE-1 domain-containing protein n=1 Tax=Dryococelus australis TaxID=614101 RepID=A0ABQ9IIV3_9NEOP|nr:hypothetical protein PR048_001972 [Dryococelus australis]
MLADAWENLTKSNLQRAWRKLWPDEESRIEENENEDCIVNEVTELCCAISGLEQCDKNYASEWLAVDDRDTEIVESDGDENENDVEEAGSTHSKAFMAAETLMSWLKKQTESTPT